MYQALNIFIDLLYHCIHVNVAGRNVVLVCHTFAARTNNVSLAFYQAPSIAKIPLRKS